MNFPNVALNVESSTRKEQIAEMNTISNDEHERRLELYNKGYTDRKIAEELHYSACTIAQWRWNNGLKPNHEPVKHLTEDEQNFRIDLYNKGFGDLKIASICGVTKSAITQWRWKNGLKSNRNRGNK